MRAVISVACLVVTAGCDDGATLNPDATVKPDAPPTPVTVRWKLMTAAGEVVPCPPGFDVVEVVVGSSHGTAGLRPQPFPCADGVAMFDLAPPPVREAHGVLVRISRALGGEVFGTSGPIGVLIPHNDGRPVEIDLTISADLGHLDLRWTLTGGAPTTCQALGLTVVQIDVTPATGAPVAQSAVCTTGAVRRFPSGPAHVVITAGTASVAFDTVVPTGGLTTRVDSVLAF